MKTISLYRKYRPETLKELCGQKIPKKILQNILVSKKIGHAYIFCGPKGVGKTSSARMFAKYINCENPNVFECKGCKACDNIKNDSIDIIEIDGASNNKVDEARELKNKINIFPTELKYKVYIIDEVQMLTKEAFNALLKTFEEPPEYVVFVLATTELSKIPDTILSRCQIIEFKEISVEDIIDRLKYVCEKEQISYELQALKIIAENSTGGMRDALSIMETIINYSENINIDSTNEVLNLMSKSEIQSLLEGVYNKNIDEVLNKINNIDKFDVKKVLYQMINEVLKSNYVKKYDLIVTLNKISTEIKNSEYKNILFKSMLIEYLNGVSKKNDVERVVESPKLDKQKNFFEIPEKNMIDIKINNCLFGASKTEKEKWKKEISKIDALKRAELELASDKYLVFSTSLVSDAGYFNSLIIDIEKEIIEKTKRNIKIVFVSKTEIKKILTNYIINKKNNILPEFIEEPCGEEYSEFGNMLEITER